MNIINRIFGPPKRRTPRPQPTLTPDEDTIAEETRLQEEFRRREEAARVSGESVSGGLEEFLKRSENNLHARQMAITRRKTAEAEARAIKAEHEAERLTTIAQAEQKKAEAATAQLRCYSAEEDFTIGYEIFEAFFFGPNKLTDVQVAATLSTPQARKELEEARSFGDPRLIRAVLKRFKGYASNPTLFPSILPDANLQEYFKQMVATPSPIPFWNF